MYIITTILGIVGIILITSQNVKASNDSLQHYGEWIYQKEVDEFDGTKKHTVASQGITKHGNLVFLAVIYCNEIKVRGIHRGFALVTQGRLKSQADMRIRLDEGGVKTIDVVHERTGELEELYIPYEIEIDKILEKMKTAQTMMFEVFDNQNQRNIVSVNLEGFTEAWKHVSPHC